MFTFLFILFDFNFFYVKILLTDLSGQKHPTFIIEVRNGKSIRDDKEKN